MALVSFKSAVFGCCERALIDKLQNFFFIKNMNMLGLVGGLTSSQLECSLPSRY